MHTLSAFNTHEKKTHQTHGNATQSKLLHVPNSNCTPAQSISNGSFISHYTTSFQLDREDPVINCLWTQQSPKKTNQRNGCGWLVEFFKIFFSSYIFVSIGCKLCVTIVTYVTNELEIIMIDVILPMCLTWRGLTDNGTFIRRSITPFHSEKGSRFVSGSYIVHLYRKMHNIWASLWRHVFHMKVFFILLVVAGAAVRIFTSKEIDRYNQKSTAMVQAIGYFV